MQKMQNIFLTKAPDAMEKQQYQAPLKVIEWPQFLKSGLPAGENLSSMTIGIFDGVHLGHQALIDSIVSHNAHSIPVIVTFRQNHKAGNKKQKEIQTFQQRLEIFESLGIKIAIVVEFTEEFRRMPGIEFLKILLKRGNVGFFAVGSDFRCGYQLDTDAPAIYNFFCSCNIPVEIIPQVMEGSAPISSSRIRNAITAGEYSLAEKMIGRSVWK
jgi:riboflavin kinase/FMN adenylyltransferase